jgi:hypothetical protein
MPTAGRKVSSRLSVPLSTEAAGLEAALFTVCDAEAPADAALNPSVEASASARLRRSFGLKTLTSFIEFPLAVSQPQGSSHEARKNIKVRRNSETHRLIWCDNFLTKWL